MKVSLRPQVLLPGLAPSMAVAGAAMLLERAEVMAAGHAWLEALVLAILLGSLVRVFWTPTPRFEHGIHCAAKLTLELAVVLMGATINFSVMVAAGLPLLASIVATVAGAIMVSFLIGRALGLPSKMAILIACGNAICGNSAIAAVAPVIDADSDDVATSIAFTAVLGIGVVIALPIIAYHLHLSAAASGILAGLTVYAVPQVIAAAGPMGTAAVQLGTLVKLVRVLMLGPIVTLLSLLMARRAEAGQSLPTGGSVLRLMPPFILAFLALATAHSVGALPETLIAPAHRASGLLTILAMAGLGLGVDPRSVSAAGPRVVFVVTASLLVLGATAFVMLRLMGIG